MVMRFDQIEHKLAEHCKTSKCVIERIEAHKRAIAQTDFDPARNITGPLVKKLSPFGQHKG